MKRPTDTKQAIQRPSRWHRPLWWLNVCAALVLLLTYLAAYISPVHSWPLAVLAMSFTYQLPVHAFFLVWWFLFRRKRMLLSGALLLIGWGHVGDHVQVFGKTAPGEEIVGEPVKVMSYNVRLFDLYDWTNGKEAHDSIFAQLHREDPDILCIQEYFYSPDPRFFRTRDLLMKDFRYKYRHERFSHKARHQSHFGIATFSVRPTVASGFIPFPENPDNLCIWTDIALPADTIRVYNAHLASYHFGDADYKFIQDLDTDTHSDSLKQGGERILRRLRRGFNLRADEVHRIAEHMRQSPHPVVYCGDMNDVPMSYGYAMLRDLLDDAFVESGSGIGGTYIGELPTLRIDHILYSPELEAWGFRTLPERWSDHHAVTTMIGVRSED
ncbi:MAG: endonuclease/exonuclease/phosphatase family protein [Flavobacteriales bacterium]|nr:endonuclease/exonuclease/phosphatase family protein [Flavobacteriales bacterium]